MNLQNPDWDVLIKEIGPKLYRYFCASFPPPKAADLVQETLIRLVRKERAGALDAALGGPQAYAFGIARFVRLEGLKIQNPSFLDAEPIVHPNPSNLVAHLRWAIAQLNSVEQEVILLSIDEDCTLAQIGLQLGMPEGTVKSHVHRAKENLRRLIGESR